MYIHVYLWSCSPWVYNDIFVPLSLSMYVFCACMSYIYLCVCVCVYVFTASTSFYNLCVSVCGELVLPSRRRTRPAQWMNCCSAASIIPPNTVEMMNKLIKERLQSLSIVH